MSYLISKLCDVGRIITHLKDKGAGAQRVKRIACTFSTTRTGCPRHRPSRQDQPPAFPSSCSLSQIKACSSSSPREEEKGLYPRVPVGVNVLSCQAQASWGLSATWLLAPGSLQLGSVHLGSVHLGSVQLGSVQLD